MNAASALELAVGVVSLVIGGFAVRYPERFPNSFTKPRINTNEPVEVRVRRYRRIGFVFLALGVLWVLGATRG